MRCEIIDNFLSANECESIIEMSKNRLQASTTLNPDTGYDQTNNFRVSDQMYFRIAENSLINNIESRISAKTNTPTQHGEGLQVVFYKPGGFFKPHWDYFDPYFVGNATTLKRGGQRLITCLMYLNTLEGGGETYFNHLDLTIKPRKGRALIWWNVNEDGTLDNSTFHEGRPVPEDTIKIIATKWIREGVFT